MKRRHFIQLGASSLLGASLSNVWAVGFAEKEPDFKATFSSPVKRDDWVALWVELLQGYEKSLSPEKCWGRILPDGDRQHWAKAPKNIQGDMELVSRMMWSMSGWFTQPGRATELMARDGKVDLKSLFLSPLKNAPDPKNPEYWNLEYAGGRVNGNQYSVESPAMGLGALAAQDRFGKELPKDFKSNMAEWLRVPATGHRNSNWNLFHALAAVTCDELGGVIDEKILRLNISSCLDMYEGDGVFSDGKGKRHYDDYNYWVFATHLGLWWEKDRDRFPDLAKKIPGIIRQVTKNQPYTFSSDGGHPEFGRSITYKFTRLASLIQAYRLGFCEVPVGQIRRIVRLHLLHYLKNGAIDLKNQRLLQTLSRDGSKAIREGYNYPGSTYWAMMTFGELWRLKDDDSFWTTEEELLPVEQSDFIHKMPVQGWKYIGAKRSGAVVQINYGADGSTYYASKYQKQAYHGQLGFVVGTSRWAPCDQMATLVVGEKSSYPKLTDWDHSLPEFCRKNEAFGKGEDAVKVTHLLLPVGETLLRVTKIEVPENVAPGSQIHLGGYALGYSADEKPKFKRSSDLLAAQSPRFQTIFYRLGGVGESGELVMDGAGYRGKTKMHTREQSFVLPYQKLDLVAGKTLLLAQVTYGSMVAENPVAWAKRFKLQELTEDQVIVKVDGVLKSQKFA